MFKLIFLHRTMCNGCCPVYKLKIRANGLVEYTGEHYVKVKGKHSWTLDAKAIEKLNDAIEKWRYFELDEPKEFIHILDVSSCITFVRMEDGRKRLIDHNDPESGKDDPWSRELFRFENSVEKIVGVKKYIGDGEVCI